MARKNALTPAMQQYVDIKKRYPDAILLFRMGDFYETFFEDAKKVSRDLNIVLTSRGTDTNGNPIPLAGIPYHALDAYLAKLVRKGHKVVIVEQVEDPKKAKGLVKRDVVRVVTPGTVIEDSILSDRDSNYLIAITCDRDRKRFGLAILELSTGEFFATEVTVSSNRLTELLTEVSRFPPAEIILPSSLYHNFPELVKALGDVAEGCAVNEYTDSSFMPDIAGHTIKSHFNVISLEGLGLEGKPLMTSATGAVLSYVKETQFNALSYINKLSAYSTMDKMVLDHTTLRNLEITRNIVDNSVRGTLLSIMDRTRTSMGSRLLKKLIVAPETDISTIRKRLATVALFMENPMEREELVELMADMNDMERIMSRVSFGTASPKDLVALKNSLAIVPLLREKLMALRERGPQDSGVRADIDHESAPPETMLADILESMADMSEVTELIGRAVVDNPPTTVREGGIIRDGYSQELDAIKESIREAQEYIASLEDKERERTGIKSLKVGFNKVFGYYIEVSNANRDLVPEDYIRKQTLVNSERYITNELKAKEAVVLSAQERIHDMEYELFVKLRERVAGWHSDIKAIAGAVAMLDVLVSFAVVSQENGYSMPVVDDSDIIHIIDGRHPVVERLIEEPFVPNDTTMNSKDNRIIILTGPNMAGKSTYMRQIALIVIMAQMGCFVPAKYARIGVLDRIFTRVGAHDDLLRGQSTFMVEMVQLANILNNATPRSLVILDEIGRGTSTFDGLSLAWAVVEYLQRHAPKTKVTFATHYHHLTELANIYRDVKNYKVLVEERGEDIVFVRRIVPGAADKSYGIEVARVAGLPVEVIERAREVLRRIEEENIIETVPAQGPVGVKVSVGRKGKKGIKSYTQYVLFPFEDQTTPGSGQKGGKYDEVIERIRKADLENMTPLEALLFLKELKEALEKND